ncbi:MAG: hypothetical protein KGL15_11365, partial [Acidobacteriota bacterium]|nr:hypothetical protein [Acidobacteriota bacterium]
SRWITNWARATRARAGAVRVLAALLLMSEVLAGREPDCAASAPAETVPSPTAAVASVSAPVLVAPIARKDLLALID